ncbi:MAG: hypothetical protein IJN58_08320 [Clostridia bacterium]|nr:hypothetical protein [Clostridia bacterium]
MILRQFENHVVALLGQSEVTIQTGASTKDTFIPHTNGMLFGFSRACETVITSLSSLSMGVMFVTGGTAPQKESVWIDGNVVSGISTTVTKETATDDNGVPYTSATYSITNNNASAITIDEVCWLTLIYKTQYGNSPYIADRTRLASPITIEPGGIGQVTYTVKVSWPTA